MQLVILHTHQTTDEDERSQNGEGCDVHMIDVHILIFMCFWIFYFNNENSVATFSWSEIFKSILQFGSCRVLFAALHLFSLQLAYTTKKQSRPIITSLRSLVETFVESIFWTSFHGQPGIQRTER